MSKKPLFPTAARLFALVEDLDAGKELTISGIKRRYKVQDNAAREYIKFLQSVRNLEECAVNGTKRWSLARPDPAERAVVHVAALELALAALDWLATTPYHEQLHQLRADVAAKVPPRDHDHVQRFVRTVRMRPFAQPEDRATFGVAASTLLEAIRDHRPCQMRYQRLDGEIKDYRIDPCEILLQANSVYLLARKAPGGDVRIFALERIEHVRCIASETFIPPAPNDDLGQLLADSFGVYIDEKPPQRVRLAIRGPVLVELRRRRVHTSQALGPAQPDGWAEVVFRVALSVPLRQWILARIPDIRVLEPISLRDQLRAAAHAFAALDPSAGGTDPSGI